MKAEGDATASGWSLTARLTALYAGTTFVVLVLAAGYLYHGLSQSLVRNDRALVDGKIQVLRLLLAEPADKPDALASEIEHEADANQVLKYYLRVMDRGGAVAIETTGMSEFLPAAIFPRPAGMESSVMVERTLPSGRTYLLAAALNADREHPVLHVALDIVHRETLLADYRGILLVAVIAGTALAAALGVLVARTGLRPLRTITRTTQQITASRLNERLVAETWPPELRDLATAFDGMLDRLQDSFNRLMEFSSDMAHAMRNPINNLRGETEVALSRARSAEEYRLGLMSALEEYERLSRLIEELLFLARADNPRAALAIRAFPVRPELEAVSEFYEALAAEQQVALRCEGGASLAADPALLRRALGNLLGNALRHTPPGGSIVLAARSRPDGGTDIVVTDTGTGIAPEHLPKIFDRLYQVDKSQATPARGAGLGLAIVRSIMLLHGGQATASSVVGRGTTITLSFAAPSGG